MPDNGSKSGKLQRMEIRPTRRRRVEYVHFQNCNSFDDAYPASPFAIIAL